MKNTPVFHKLDFVRGSMFTKNTLLESPNTALISKELANKVFASVDVIGSSLVVDGKSVVIMGVYERDQSILSKMSSDGLSDLILPYTSDLSQKTDSVSHIYVKNAPQKEKPSPLKAEEEKEEKPADERTTEVSSTALGELDASLSGMLSGYYEKTSFAERVTVSGQYLSVFWFTLGMVLVFFLLRACLASFKDTFLWAFHVHQSVNKLEWTKVLSSLILPAVLIGGMAAVILLTKFQIYLPSDVIPKGDHMLDFSHYFDQFISSFQLRNRSAADPYYLNLALYSANIAWPLTILSALFEIGVLRVLYRWCLPFIKGRKVRLPFDRQEPFFSGVKRCMLIYGKDAY